MVDMAYLSVDFECGTGRGIAPSLRIDRIDFTDRRNVGDLESRESMQSDGEIAIYESFMSLSRWIYKVCTSTSNSP